MICPQKAMFAVICYNNSYGESWDSTCEKLWVPVQTHWVPIKKSNESQTENVWSFMQPDS